MCLLLLEVMVAIAESGPFAVLEDYLSITQRSAYSQFGNADYRVSPPKDELLCDAQALCNGTNNIGFSCKPVSGFWLLERNAANPWICARRGHWMGEVRPWKD